MQNDTYRGVPPPTYNYPPYDPYAQNQPVARGNIQDVERHRTLNRVWPTINILIWCALCILTTVGMTVTIQMEGIRIPPFPYFIFWATSWASAATFFVIYWIFLLLRWIKKKYEAKSTLASMIPFNHTKPIPRIPQYKFMLLGFILGTSGIFVLFPNPHVPNLMQALLSPTVATIPFAIILSQLIFRHHFKWWQYLHRLATVLIIGAGIAVCFMPLILHANKSAVGNIGWDLLFLSASLPAALVGVLEEKMFADQPAQVIQLNAWISFYQAVFTVITFPINMIPHFGTAASFMDSIHQQWYALKCAFGYYPPPDICVGCQCDTAGWGELLVIFFYVTSNLTLLGVIKYGNAVFAFVVSTLVVPLSEFTFAIKFIMGADVGHLTQWNIYSLIILVFGVVFFRVFDKKKSPAEREQEKENQENFSRQHQPEYVPIPTDTYRY